MAHRAGNARCVDMIDFMQYTVPTLVAESLRKQVKDIVIKEANGKRKRGKKAAIKDPPTEVQIVENNMLEVINETCHALQCLSKACRLTECYSISKEDLIEIDRYLQIPIL